LTILYAGLLYPKVYPNEQSVVGGSKATFVCLHDKKVTWKYQGNELPPGTIQVDRLEGEGKKSYLIIEHVTVNNAGVYSCEYEEEEDHIRLYDVATLVWWSYPYEFGHDSISMAHITRENIIFVI